MYTKQLIRNTYNDFVEHLKVININESVTAIKIVFRPDIKKLFVYYEIDGCEFPSLADEVNDFGLTPFKELLSAVHKKRKENKDIVNNKIMMDI